MSLRTILMNPVVMKTAESDAGCEGHGRRRCTTSRAKVLSQSGFGFSMTTSAEAIVCRPVRRTLPSGCGAPTPAAGTLCSRAAPASRVCPATGGPAEPQSVSGAAAWVLPR